MRCLFNLDIIRWLAIENFSHFLFGFHSLTHSTQPWNRKPFSLLIYLFVSWKVSHSKLSSRPSSLLCRQKKKNERMKERNWLTIWVHARSIDFPRNVLSVKRKCLFNWHQLRFEWSFNTSRMDDLSNNLIVSLSILILISPLLCFAFNFQIDDSKIKRNKTRKSCDRNSNRGPRIVG